MTSGKHILVIDDDNDILELLKAYLEKNGLSVHNENNGESGLEYLATNSVDLVVLDIMMPGPDGFEVCKRIRSHSQVPIIMLTAVSDETDRIIGLELGADDYMEKPFNPRELFARIKAVLRRSEEQYKPVSKTEKYAFGQWIFDEINRVIIGQDGIPEPINGAEYELLKAFLHKPGQVLTRDEISNLLKGRESLPFERAIDVQISRMRQKLRDDAKNPQLIKTVRGAGYVLASEVTPVVE